jgi:hypothetical protein
MMAPLRNCQLVRMGREKRLFVAIEAPTSGNRLRVER